MFKEVRQEDEKFDKVFNRFRENTRNLRLQQIVHGSMFHQRKLSKLKKMKRAKMASWYRSEKLRKSYYAS
ncbi:MAG: hypothetical protein NTZ80_02065 [Patescibacteria group bacterium]|nr:hypothetical protein [Patescibacteria group bacterium]